LPTLPLLLIMNAIRDFRIVIADDHPVIRHAITHALSSIPNARVEAAARSGTELLGLLAQSKWDMIITDFTMNSAQSDTDGLALIAQLRHRYARIPVIVFTMLNNDDALIRLARTGVAAIVDKCEGVDEFRTATLEVMHRRRPYYSQRIRARLQHFAKGGETRTGKDLLTKKEIEVIRLFASGASLTDIARHVSRSISTVATQKSVAMKKLHVRTNAELVKYVQENGLT
jgi:two-component system, NarL family, captular synthesis response regulator RcsB